MRTLVRRWWTGRCLLHLSACLSLLLLFAASHLHSHRTMSAFTFSCFLVFVCIVLLCAPHPNQTRKSQWLFKFIRSTIRSSYGILSIGLIIIIWHLAVFFFRFFFFFFVFVFCFYCMDTTHLQIEMLTGRRTHTHTCRMHTLESIPQSTLKQIKCPKTFTNRNQEI